MLAHVPILETAFNFSSERSKRRKTLELRSSVPSIQLTHAASSSLFNAGNIEAGTLVQEMISTPTRAKEILKKWKDTEQNQTEMSPEEALAYIMECNMSVDTYNKTREIALKHGYNLFPSYKKILVAKEETVARINNKGVTVLKWKDRREVLMISTKHTNKIINVDRSRKTVKQKPEVVVDYNTGKGYIDLTDQLQSYHSALRKSLKWYRKIIIDLICNISVLNALSLFIGVNGQKMKIMKFREAIIEELLQNDDDDTQQSELIQPSLPTLDHTLEKSPKTSRCKSCYSLLAKKEGTLIFI